MAWLIGTLAVSAGMLAVGWLVWRVLGREQNADDDKG